MTVASSIKRLLRPLVSAARSCMGTEALGRSLRDLLAAVERAEAQRSTSEARLQTTLLNAESRILARIAEAEGGPERIALDCNREAIPRAPWKRVNPLGQAKESVFSQPEHALGKEGSREQAGGVRQSPAAGERDLVCKWLEFSPHAGAYLVLPPLSDDPVVRAYRNAEMINSYMVHVLLETTEPGDQIIDLGCHVGTFSVPAAVLGRKVLAVDASPAHIWLVELSKAINSLANLETCHAAVAAEEGTVRFLENGLFGSLDFRGGSPDAIHVIAKHLDSIVSARHLGPVRFLKMDIEGAEADALTTGAGLLRRDQPVIWFESNGPTLELAGHSVDELRASFESHGYRAFRVEGCRWIYAPVGQIQPEAWVDMLALSQRDQQRWSSRIDWEWAPAAVLEKCRAWADLPHANTCLHLLHEIEKHRADSDIGAAIQKLAPHLQARLAQEP